MLLVKCLIPPHSDTDTGQSLTVNTLVCVPFIKLSNKNDYKCISSFSMFPLPISPQYSALNNCTLYLYYKVQCL